MKFIPAILVISFFALTAVTACDRLHPPGEGDQRLFPAYDSKCDSLTAAPASARAVLGRNGAFRSVIGRQIHQIWFGDRTSRVRTESAGLVQSWRLYGQHKGYSHRLWTNDDLAELATFMLPQNYDLLGEMLAVPDYPAASDIVRYEILNAFGGVYVDCDMRPPTLDGEFVDIEEFAPLRGLVLATEWQGRDVGTGSSALFVMNGLIMSCPHHPVIEHVVASLKPNVDSWRREQGGVDAMYSTGPMLLNRSLAGSFALIPITFLDEMNILPN